MKVRPHIYRNQSVLISLVDEPSLPSGTSKVMYSIFSLPCFSRERVEVTIHALIQTSQQMAWGRGQSSGNKVSADEGQVRYLVPSEEYIVAAPTPEDK